jgi:hypothetical protein
LSGRDTALTRKLGAFAPLAGEDPRLLSELELRRRLLHPGQDLLRQRDYSQPVFVVLQSRLAVRIADLNQSCARSLLNTGLS